MIETRGFDPRSLTEMLVQNCGFESHPERKLSKAGPGKVTGRSILKERIKAVTMRHIRITSVGSDGTRPEWCSMTGISVQFSEAEAADYSICYAKALDSIVSELKRYALGEALRGIGIRPPVSTATNHQ